MIDAKQLGRRIKELRLAKGFRRADTLARLAHVSNGLLSEIERGEIGDRVAFRSLEKIANALGMSLSELLSGHQDPRVDPSAWERADLKLDVILSRLGSRQLEVLPPATGTVRVYGRAAAGLGEYSEPVSNEPNDFVSIPDSIASLPGRKIAFRVSGDSMAPYLREGDIVIVWYGEQTLLRERLVQGDIMVITDGGNEEFVKSVYWDDGAESIRMVSLNINYSDRHLAYENIRWSGLVVGWVKGWEKD